MRLIIRYDWLMMLFRDRKLEPEDVSGDLFYLDEPKEAVYRQMGHFFTHPWTNRSGNHWVLESVAGQSAYSRIQRVRDCHAKLLQILNQAEQEGRVAWKTCYHWSLDDLAALLMRHGRGKWLNRFDEESLHILGGCSYYLRLSQMHYEQLVDKTQMVPLTLMDVHKLAMAFGGEYEEDESSWSVLSNRDFKTRYG